MKTDLRFWLAMLGIWLIAGLWYLGAFERITQ
jgi:hypothetical protein